MNAQKASLRKLGPLVVCISLTVLLVGIVTPANFCLAQGSYNREEWNLPKFYPKGFDGYGRIGRMADNEIVISETRLKLSHNIRYATRRDPNASNYAFQAGNLVGYILNKNREIVSLWLIR